MSDLKEHIQAIAKMIESGFDSDGESIQAFNYVDDTYDINYLVNADKSYKGARLLVAFGGPNIWIDTFTQTVEGYWWNERVDARYSKDEIGLDDMCEEFYGC
jgi:hypothetical protein